MKKHVLLFVAALLSLNCMGQKKDEEKSEANKKQGNKVEHSKTSWKVDEKIDDNRNLIRYDSFYSFSSSQYLENPSMEKNSLLQSIKPRSFKNLSDFKNLGIDDILGSDYMDLDKITQQLIARVKKFLEKYQSDFIVPEVEN